jgi:hypothetical protein
VLPIASVNLTDTSELQSFDMFWTFKMTLGRISASRELEKRKGSIDFKSAYFSVEYLERKNVEHAKNNVQIGNQKIWTYHIFDSPLLTNYLGQNSAKVMQLKDMGSVSIFNNLNTTQVAIATSEISQVTCPAFNGSVTLPELNLTSSDFNKRTYRSLQMDLRADSSDNLRRSDNQNFVFSTWMKLNASNPQEIHNWFKAPVDSVTLSQTKTLFSLKGVFQVYLETMDQFDTDLRLPVKQTFLRVFEQGKLKVTGDSVFRDLTDKTFELPHDQWIKLVILYDNLGSMSIQMFSLADMENPWRTRNYKPDTKNQIFHPDFSGQYDILQSFNGLIKEMSLRQ